VETLEKNILENTRKRERELVEKKTLIDRLYERLELTREMVAEGEQTLTKCESKLRKTKEENEMLRKVLEECKRKESTWKRKEERQRRKAKEARETMRDCWVKMDKVAEACNEIAKSGNEEEEEEEEDALDGGDDAKEVEQQKQESVARENENEEEDENKKEVNDIECAKKKYNTPHIHSLVQSLSKSVRNLESAVQKERSYRKMADTEVELARRCVDEVGGGLENADLKIAAARLTKALSLLKHNDSNNGR
tara:strand:- start:2492 stop:3247 length:756 start_codon:yes stop_codon:yes gene_type:complete